MPEHALSYYTSVLLWRPVCPGYGFLAKFASQATEDDYKALVRKINKRILPLLFRTYAL
jgi:hypothetical protein